MGKSNVIWTLILLFLIVADVSNADFLWNFRKLVASAPNGSPTPSPVSENENGQEKNSKDVTITNIVTPAPPPIDTKKQNEIPENDGNDNTSKGEVKEKNKGETKPEMPKEASESCDGLQRRCRDKNSMIACVKSYDEVSKALVVLVQNKGDNPLVFEVSYFVSAVEIALGGMVVPELQTYQVNMSVGDVTGNQVKVNAGHGDCVLPLVPGLSAFQNLVRWMPYYISIMNSYAFVTFVFLAFSLVAIGVCGCYLCRTEKKQSDVSYQELEMNRPETAATGVETGEGWDEVWDDDWDEEKAVKSPGHSVSANGLTSMNPKKDGWEEWDD